MRSFKLRVGSAWVVALCALVPACASDPVAGPAGHGGSAPEAGRPSGGVQSSGAAGVTGGSSTGGVGAAAGGSLATGGAAGSSTVGGLATSGSAGLTASGGASGSANGGASATTGGAANGGGTVARGGAGGNGGLVGTGGGSVIGGSVNSAGGSAGAAGSGGVFPASVTKPKIMIVGDSISAGPGCYKKYLVQNLKDNQITNYEFVGQYTDDCGGGVKHSAVSCSTAAQYTQATFMVSNCKGDMPFPGMSTLMTTHQPDMVMIQLGVNDIWGGNTPVDSVLANYEKLVQQARAQNPSVVLVVAQIHKIITDNCQNMASAKNAEDLVKAVPAWAAKLNTRTSPVFTADLWTNSDAHEADDCVHPNDAGAKRMGLNWYNAIQGLLRR